MKRRAATVALLSVALAACGGGQASRDAGSGTGGNGNGGGAAGAAGMDAAGGGDAGTGGGAGGAAGAAGKAGAAGGTAGAAGAAGRGGIGGGPAGAPSAAGAAGGGACSAASLGGGPLTTSTTHQDIGVHDPSMIWDGAKYFLFATGGTLSVRSSTNLLQWSSAGNIFSAVPAWVTTALGANPGDLWAPDVSTFNCQFHVYYAGSTFGSNTSVIGLATSPSLDPSKSGTHWTDQGMVVQSTSSDNFNAIDPNVAFDGDGAPWLAFGSFWTGIKLRQLDAATGKLSTTNTTTYAIAGRGNGGAIEAASIVSHNGFYYLFVSFDACCKGVNSTYRTMVGRASAITGPYTDKAGKNMTSGAAEQLLASSGRYIGPGGGTAWKDGDNYVYVYHYYDGDDNGASKLAIRPITFDSTDWPVLGDMLFP
jgi:arabinan endo-1,5-alpha-L-arabinosidase